MPRLRLRAVDLDASRIVALLTFWAMVALLIWFFVDERFFVYEAQVRGNALVSAEEVYRASDLHTMSIFYIDRQQVARSIQKQIPAVAQVRVRCQLPGHVRLDVQERSPRFIWRTAGEAFLLDAEGRVLKADDGTREGLVAIQDLDNVPVQPGQQVDSVAVNTVAGLHGLLPEVKTFEYSRAKGVSLTDARGWRVFFGDDRDLAEKVATLQALLQKWLQERRKVTMIDLRFPSSPCYR